MKPATHARSAGSLYQGERKEAGTAARRRRVEKTAERRETYEETQ